jgi:large subunit ribosomal protein L28
VPRVCEFCQKKTQVGNRVSRRGLPKKEGGIGLKTTGIRRRTFKPNLQKVHAVVDGKYTRILVCTGCMKAGRVTKQLRRQIPKSTAA